MDFWPDQSGPQRGQAAQNLDSLRNTIRLTATKPQNQTLLGDGRQAILAQRGDSDALGAGLLRQRRLIHVGMKRTSVEAFSDECICFVRVTGENGSQGWGQVAPYGVSHFEEPRP